MLVFHDLMYNRLDFFVIPARDGWGFLLYTQKTPRVSQLAVNTQIKYVKLKILNAKVLNLSGTAKQNVCLLYSFL